MWTRITSIALGVWLMAAPAVFGYRGAAAVDDRIVGPLAASFAFLAMWEVLRPLRRLNVALGAWLLIAPLAFRYGWTPTLNSILTGVLLILLATRHDPVQQPYGGGWSSLLTSRRRSAKEASS